MPPARLHHSDRGIGERRQRSLQQVGRWNEVSVEHQYELAAGALHAVRQSPRLVARTRVAADVPHVDAGARVTRHATARQLGGIVGGIIQHLDFEPLARVVHRAHRID